MRKHKISEHDQMKASQRRGKPLIIAHQAPEARCPSERALHHPTPGQQDEAVLGLGQFDDFQLDPMFFGLLSRYVTGIALVNESAFDRLAGALLDRWRHFPHLRSILLIGGCEK